MKLSSLKDLKVIKKDLVPEPEARPAGNQPRSKTVVHRSKEEEKALVPGVFLLLAVSQGDTMLRFKYRLSHRFFIS